MKRICDLSKHTCIVNVYVMNIRNGIWYVMYKERDECKAYVCNVWMEDVCIYGIYGHIYLWCRHMKMDTWIWNDMIKVKGNICMRCINVTYYWKAIVCEAYMNSIRMKIIYVL